VYEIKRQENKNKCHFYFRRVRTKETEG